MKMAVLYKVQGGAACPVAPFPWPRKALDYAEDELCGACLVRWNGVGYPFEVTWDALGQPSLHIAREVYEELTARPPPP